MLQPCCRVSHAVKVCILVTVKSWFFFIKDLILFCLFYGFCHLYLSDVCLAQFPGSLCFLSCCLTPSKGPLPVAHGWNLQLCPKSSKKNPNWHTECFHQLNSSTVNSPERLLLVSSPECIASRGQFIYWFATLSSYTNEEHRQMQSSGRSSTVTTCLNDVLIRHFFKVSKSLEMEGQGVRAKCKQDGCVSVSVSVWWKTEVYA